jgi:hypothetical protein
LYDVFICHHPSSRIASYTQKARRFFALYFERFMAYALNNFRSLHGINVRLNFSLLHYLTRKTPTYLRQHFRVSPLASSSPVFLHEEMQLWKYRKRFSHISPRSLPRNRSDLLTSFSRLRAKVFRLFLKHRN